MTVTAPAANKVNSPTTGRTSHGRPPFSVDGVRDHEASGRFRSFPSEKVLAGGTGEIRGSQAVHVHRG